MLGHNWPWGELGRPSDRGDSPGYLAQRPREPGGEPPPQGRQDLPEDGGRVLLVPNPQWRGVQQVQEHMARFRAMRETSRGS